MDQLAFLKITQKQLGALEQRISERGIDDIFAQEHYLEIALSKRLRGVKRDIEKLFTSINNMTVSVLFPKITVQITEYARDESKGFCTEKLDDKNRTIELMLLVAYCFEAREQVSKIITNFDSLHFG
ncbi:MAG: hypothetical protein KBD00_02060 [Candidatus Peribacteraceae bacterium]|nr:hypothetical protein [Candidatus Peribacteraceae bacterium]